MAFMGMGTREVGSIYSERERGRGPGGKDDEDGGEVWGRKCVAA
jgi:hypothetical protein